MLTPSLRSRRAFSMLELLVVLSMIGVLSLMAFGRTTSMLAGWRVARAAQAYGEELQSAFAIVGRDRKPVRITFYSAPDSMVLKITNRAGNVTYRSRRFGKNTEYKLYPGDITPSITSLEVYPPGLAADSLSVVFSRNGKFRRVRMLRGGLVQICSNPATLNAVCVPA
jgi:prepilin-type N-terminal cleavage/methylation domain-containing protein